MQCISAVKLIGGYHAQTTVCFRGCAPVTGFSPRSPLLFSPFGLNFWPLGASSPFVTPISGYVYVRVSNSKQQIMPGEFKPYKPNWSKGYKKTSKGFLEN